MSDEIIGDTPGKCVRKVSYVRVRENASCKNPSPTMRSLQFHHRFHDFNMTHDRCCIAYIIFERQFRYLIEIGVVHHGTNRRSSDDRVLYGKKSLCNIYNNSSNYLAMNSL